MIFRWSTTLRFQRVANYNGYWTLILSHTPERQQFTTVKYTPKSSSSKKLSSDPPSTPAAVSFKEKEDKFKVSPLAPLRALKPPQPPTDCCMSGCKLCVYDMYLNEIKEYEKRRNKLVALIRQSHPELSIPKEYLEPYHVDSGVQSFMDMAWSLKEDIK